MIVRFLIKSMNSIEFSEETGMLLVDDESAELIETKEVYSIYLHVKHVQTSSSFVLLIWNL